MKSAQGGVLVRLQTELREGLNEATFVLKPERQRASAAMIWGRTFLEAGSGGGGGQRPNPGHLLGQRSELDHTAQGKRPGRCWVLFIIKGTSH